MTNEGQPSLAQLFLIGVEAAVPRKRLFGGDYYEFGIVAMLATHVFERGVMLGMARADYGRALAALVLPAEQGNGSSSLRPPRLPSGSERSATSRSGCLPSSPGQNFRSCWGSKA